MAKFASLAARAKGLKARRKVTLPMLDGDPVDVDVVPLSFDESIAVMEEARDFARRRGSTDPKKGDPLYDQGIHLYTVLRACLDHDKPDTREAFFANAGEIGQALDPDRVEWLYHHQRTWQDDISPSPKDIDPAKFMEFTAALAMAPGEAEEIPLDSLPASTRRSYTRQLARAFLGLLQPRLASGSLSLVEAMNIGSSAPSGQPTSETSSSKSSEASATKDEQA